VATITKSFIDKLQPPSQGYKLYFDDDVRGFGARVTAGGKVTFFVQARVLGKELRYTIGSADHWPIKGARDQARDLVVQMNKGIDPREAKRAKKAALVTLRMVADEYMARPGKLKPSSKAQIERHVITTFKDIEHKPIADISEAYCTKRYQQLYTGGLHGDRQGGSPGQANQSLAILKALLNYAVRQHKGITVNPVNLHDHWEELDARTTYIPASKMGAVWNMLSTMRGETVGRAELSVIEMVMFSLLTGCRLGECRLLTWDRVQIIKDDLEATWWHLDDPKNGRAIWLPLSTQLIELLENRPRVKNNPYVFPGKTAGLPISKEATRHVWQLISKCAGQARLTNHDARRTFTTLGIVECKLDIAKVDLLIGHKPNSVLMKHYLDIKRLHWCQPEVQKWADWVDSKAAIARGANVVELRAKKTG
jgi:integrase